MAMRTPVPPHLRPAPTSSATAWAELPRARSRAISPPIPFSRTLLRRRTAHGAGEAAGSPERRHSGGESGRLPAVAAIGRNSRAWAPRWSRCCMRRSSMENSGKRRTATDHTNSRVTDPPTLWLGHVGDSRCYRRRRGQSGTTDARPLAGRRAASRGPDYRRPGRAVADAQPDHARHRLAGHRRGRDSEPPSAAERCLPAGLRRSDA